LLAAVVPSSALMTTANPIRKVVTMLQNMQKSVTEEGEREQKLYDRYMCYCKTGVDDLKKSIEEGTAKVEADSAAVKEAAELKNQLEADLKEHKAGRDDGKAAIAETNALREKEADAFSKTKAELETNIAAIRKAVAALEKGAGDAFLQSASAGMIRSYAMERSNIADAARQELLAFLSGSSATAYAPQSGEITGILKQLMDEMTEDLADATKEEETSRKNAEELLSAKTKEVESIQAQIEDKSARLGAIGVQTSEKINDIEDTKEAVAADQKFLQELEQGCSTKTAEWEQIKKNRAEEIVALAETIKVLNDDDALDLFNKAMPKPAGASFLQVQVAASALRSRALAEIRKGSRRSRSPKLDLIALALNGKAVGFEKVIAMVDEMSENLKKEQEADDTKRDYCQEEIDKAEDKSKSLEQSIKDSEAAIDKMEGELTKLKEEVAALKKGIVALDKSVAEATEQRKQENAEYKDLKATDGTAKEVLLWAKNRLNKFYNPKMYEAPVEVPAEDGEATEAPKGGIAGTGIGAASFVQVRAHSQARRGSAAPPPPPETFGPYTKKSEDSAGVLQMIDLLVNDLDKEMQEADVNEKDAQEDYAKLVEDAGEKRAADAKLIVEKETAAANTEDALQDEKARKKDTTKELMGALEVTKSIHVECDWLLQNYGARKEARASEADALSNAKAVLSGADYSLLQLGASSSRARSGNFMSRRK